MKSNHKIHRITIVEDDPLQRTLFRVLIETNFPWTHIMTARDGIEGLHLLERATPSLLLTGLMMPRMNGFHMLQHLLDVGANYPMLIVSTYLWQYDRDPRRCAQLLSILDCVDLRRIGFLVKPFRVPEFIREVGRLMLS